MTAVMAICCLIGGWFFRAGYVHRQVRLDIEVLGYLRLHGPQWYSDLEGRALGGPLLPVRIRNLERRGLIKYETPGTGMGYELTEAGRGYLLAECASVGKEQPR